MSRLFFPRRLLAVSACALLVLAPPALAQTPPQPVEDLAQVYNQALGAFAKGDNAAAIAGLDKILAEAPPDAKLESVHFTLAAACFNAGQYDRALAALQKFLELYPASPRREEALLSLAQAAMLAKDYALAVQTFRQLEKSPRHREEALLGQGQAYKESGQVERGIAPLESLVGQKISSPASATGALLLGELYARSGQGQKAIGIVNLIRDQIERLDNVVRFNSLAVEAGDYLLRSDDPSGAQACYQAVLSKEEVIQLQSDRIAAANRRIAANLAALKANPTRVVDLLPETNRLRASAEASQKRLESFRKLPDFRPPLLIRTAAAYYTMGRPWEAMVVYDELLQKFPGTPEREATLFGAITASAEANRPERAQKFCTQYLAEFPSGPNAPTVGYLLGATALQANNPGMAETYFGRVLAEQPGSSFRETMRYLLADAKFAQGKYGDAAAEYERYLRDFPNGVHREDADYRIAMGGLFAGDYEKAAASINAYLQKYPRGTYAADAKYRLMVCQYAAGDYERILAACRAWEKDFPNNPQLGEVLALEADSLAALGRDEDALPVYQRSAKLAATDEVRNYSLSAAQKLLQKAGDWPGIAAMYEGFVADHPDHPMVVTAVYWIGKARAREGNTQEAIDYIAATARKHINDPASGAVERLLTELAQIGLKQSPPISAETLFPAAQLTTTAARARVEFLRAELARLGKKPDEHARQLDAIAALDPGELSPRLLAEAGDHLFAKGNLDGAKKFYTALLDGYPKSDEVEFAYAGLAGIAIAQGDPDRALRLCDEAVDGGFAGQKLKDLTLCRAQALLALDRLDDSKKVFEQIASVREWRGEATAQAMYSLGEIEEKRGRAAEANAYYQRVFVAYQRFLPWVAKAYIASARMLEKLGKPQEAANTYREMLRNPKLEPFEEAAEARKRLQQLGNG